MIQKKISDYVDDMRKQYDSQDNLFDKCTSWKKNDYKHLGFWPLMQLIQIEQAANPCVVKNLEDSDIVAAMELWLRSVRDIGHVVCRSCYGWGHSWEYCPTHSRLEAALPKTGAIGPLSGWLRNAVTRKLDGFGLTKAIEEDP